jgi:hypothetical protein
MGLSVKETAEKYQEHSETYSERQQILIELRNIEVQLSGMPYSNPERKALLGLKDRALERLRQVNYKIKVGGRSKDSLFREIVTETLPESILARVNEEIYRRQCGEPPLKVSMLTEEEENAMAYYIQLDRQYKDLHAKVRKAKEVIQAMMPNLHGELDEYEYKRRALKTKILSRVLRALNGETL